VTRTVEIIDDWNALMEHARYCRVILYKVDPTPRGYRLRVRVGGFGYDKELSPDEIKDKEEYLKKLGAVRVVDSVPDHLFFA
jgi:hypothetical protein